jgi:disulfide bond formation protein DsbB
VNTRPDLAAAGAILVVGLAAIVAAWAFQLIGGYVPCMLCLQERIPYYVGLPLALIAFGAAYAGASAGIVRLFLLLAGLAFLVNVGLGVYHAGAEWAWWPGPSTCGAAPTPASGDLLDQLDNIRIVSCTEASWRLFGLSFAGWNAVISLVIVLVALWGASRPGPRQA